MTAMNKPELRAEIRRNRLDESTRRNQSRKICDYIIDSAVYKNATVIGGYIPLKHEADITPVMVDALKSGKVVAIPMCGEAPYMTMRRVDDMADLVPGAYGILQPPEVAPIVAVDDIDLLLVPLEGIDARGIRLGKGGGYYDCLLSGRNVETMGCALSCQIVDEIPCEFWDVPLKMCAAPDGLRCYGHERIESRKEEH